MTADGFAEVVNSLVAGGIGKRSSALHRRVQRWSIRRAARSRPRSAVIETAKGVLSERWRTTMDDAFDRLRRDARVHNEHLSDVARRVTTGELGPADLVGPAAS